MYGTSRDQNSHFHSPRWNGLAFTSPYSPTPHRQLKPHAITPTMFHSTPLSLSSVGVTMSSSSWELLAMFGILLFHTPHKRNIVHLWNWNSRGYSPALCWRKPSTPLREHFVINKQQIFTTKRQWFVRHLSNYSFTLDVQVHHPLLASYMHMWLSYLIPSFFVQLWGYQAQLHPFYHLFCPYMYITHTRLCTGLFLLFCTPGGDSWGGGEGM